MRTGFEPRGIAGGGVVNHEGGRDFAARPAGPESRAHDATWIDGQRGADACDIKDVVVSIADHIELRGRCQSAGDGVVMVHGEAAAVKFAAKNLAVEANMLVMPGIGRDAVQVGIVITEDDVDGAGESAA